MSEEVKVSDQNGVRWVELHRPESKNGLTVETNASIIEAVRGAQGDAGVRVLVLYGAGGSFCSGLDLRAAMKEGGLLSRENTEERGRVYFIGLIRALRALNKPTIAAVDGTAVGYGCDLALACDLRICSPRARFGEVFVRRGLMPDGGGTFLLPRLVGLGRALEMMYTGDFCEAEEAVRIGMANRVLGGDFAVEVRGYAERLAKGPPLAYAAIKQAVHAGLSGDLDAALDRELDAQLGLLASADFAEGVAAFLGKREPVFRGK